MSLHEIISNPGVGPSSAEQPPAETGAGVKRSWRRKYRKMRHVFESRMEMSNSLIKHEHRAKALARRLQEENDQLLDLLLDLNEGHRLPGYLRYRLDSPIADSASPLPSDDPPKDVHSLSNIPHTYLHPDIEPDQVLEENASGYLSPSHEEEYCLSIDAALADPAACEPNGIPGRPLRMPERHVPDEKQLALQNPDSTYNWLRKHQPQVFLQDKDHENASEKSSARPAGSQRGKRGSAVAANATPVAPKTEQELLDEEIGFIPETGTSSARSRRNKDDEPYRPKGGSSRTTKRKRDDTERGSARKKLATKPPNAVA